jgi:hypothetical protein
MKKMPVNVIDITYYSMKDHFFYPNDAKEYGLFDIDGF